MLLSQIDPVTIALIAVAFLFAGISKGVVGFGLPLIAIPMLANVMPVPTAIALTAVPIVASNVFQALRGGHWRAALRRFRALIAGAVIGTLAGAQILTRADQGAISVVVGALLVVFVAMHALPLRPAVAPRAESWLNLPVGLLSGLLGGVASMFGPPFLLYFVALRLPRDAFIGTIALIYLIGVVPLYGTLIGTGVIGPAEAVASALACIPLFIGIRLGGWLRDRVSQPAFQRLLLVALAIIGLNLIRRGFM